MTTKVFDTFNGTAGTDLAAHTPDIGGSWTDTELNAVELDGVGGAKFAGNGRSSWIDAGTANQWCVANFNAGGADNRVSVELRRNAVSYPTRDCYVFNFRTGDTGADVKIYKVISGSFTEISTENVANWDNATTYSLEPEIDGSALDFIIDGTSTTSLTDTAITAGDYAGMTHLLFSSSGARFYDFKIDDAAPGVGVAIPVFMNHYRNQGIL